MEIPFRDEELLAEVSWLRQLARALARDEARAEDLCQETLLAALQARPQTRSGLRAWLGGTLRKLAAREHRGQSRRQRREERVARSESNERHAELFEQADLHAELLAQVRALPAHLAEVVLLHYLRGLTVAQIARELRAPTGTVRSHLHRARAELRAALDRKHRGREHWLPLVLPWKSPSSSTTSAASLTKAAALMAMKTSTLLCALTAALILGLAFLLWQPKGPAAVGPLETQAEIPAANEDETEAAPVTDFRREEVQLAPAEDKPQQVERVKASDLLHWEQSQKKLAIAGPTGQIVLTMLDGDSGRPVDHGRVRAMGSNYYADQAFEQSTFSLTLAPSEYSLLVHALGYEPLEIEGIQVLADEVQAIGTYVLETGKAEVFGTVQAADQELAGIRLELHGAGRRACQTCQAGDALTPCEQCGYSVRHTEQYLDREGGFQFTDLASGEYLLAAYTVGGLLLGHKNFELSAKERKSLSLDLAFLDLPVRLVFDNGDPFRGVWASQSEVYSDPIRMRLAANGVLCGQGSWSAPSVLEINRPQDEDLANADVDPGKLRRQLLGVEIGGVSQMIAPVDDARQVYLDPRLPEPRPSMQSRSLAISEYEPGVYLIQAVPSQSASISVTCGPYAAHAEIDLNDFDGQAIVLQMNLQHAELMEMDGKVSCVTCHAGVD